MKRYIGLITMLIGMFFSQQVFASSSSIFKSDLQDAAEFYKNGKYKESAEVYQNILDQKMENGAIHYNLGNAYFKNSQLGKAILEYERALRLMPRDRDVLFNLQHAESLVKGPSVDANMPWITVKLHNFNFDEILKFFLWVLFLSGTIIIASFFLGYSNTTRFILAGLSVVILSATFCAMIIKKNMEHGLAITMTQSDVKFEPRKDATTHFVVYEGTKVRIKQEVDGWHKIERLDGKGGWIEDFAAEKI
ncbi:MAG: tetratricopeptide repeat protein [Candidatus Omnitrophica bacterium]|nr:tetratricopeptide repeat protein [Candidatus Omnitrophota bacterium]